MDAARELPASLGFHVVAKPTGPICNLDCRYCFYLEKERLYAGTTAWAMWNEKPGMIFEDCTFHGSIVHAYGSLDTPDEPPRQLN